MENPYKVLGVSNNAPIDVCKKAYRKLCMKYHPDSGSGDLDAFERVQKAWGMIQSGVAIPLVTKKAVIHRSLFKFDTISV